VDNPFGKKDKPVSDRKYRQRGYQDSAPEKSQHSGEKPAPRKDNTFGPRAIQMPGRRTVSRCSQCGTVLQAQDNLDAKCPKCGFELHSCKQCAYFDPSSRFECTQPVPDRISPKDKPNQCAFYTMRVMVEKETSTPAAAKPADARQAFENLFKK
jgi:predicted RNA-binding Zn-ribbon protein involved in translation (DUF1610 family)